MTDPVLERRARAQRLATIGKRVGSVFCGLAVVFFFVGLATQDFGAWGVAVIVALGLATATLAPAIVLGYAVTTAAREDVERER